VNNVIKIQSEKNMAMFLAMGHAMLQKTNVTIKTRDIMLSPTPIMKNEKNISITRPN
jgi:hypothetical protein